MTTTARVTMITLLCFAFSAPAQTIERKPVKDVDPNQPPAFAEALEAGKTFKVPRGLDVKLFAAEPQLVSPVAIAADPRTPGRLYVVETFRAWGNGGMDMRFYMPWLEDDLAARTVADRVSWVTRRAGESAKNLTLDSDRIRLIEDKNGDGQADSATIFTDGYRATEDGIAAGVLARRNGEVLFANIPSLYTLKDTNNDGKADDRAVMHSGFGVHYQFLGHDLHGLIVGPDGRLYFSVGDRGAHVKTREGKTLENPDSGAVFRCELDGSNLEIVHTGLRNPQELAFDQYGNLFTADNNCDMYDAARWVYVVEGGDSGWRCGYQYIREPNTGGPWLAEKLWHLDHDHPAAYCLPPIGHSPSGPSGLAYYPGTGLGDQYANTFFLADFRGGTNSGVWAHTLRNKGATFEIASKRQFLWNLLPTDVEFAIDGGLYVTDWVNGWFRPMKGRIWKVTSEQAAQSSIVAETKQLLINGMGKQSEKDLIALLAHKDQRVRLEAQFELASRQSDTILSRLHKLVSLEDADQLARIHAVWALSQLARRNPADTVNLLEPVAKLIDDGDSEIRCQAIKAIGDAKYTKGNTYDAITRRLWDETARVRFFAAMAIAKIGPPPPPANGSKSATVLKPETIRNRVLYMLRLNDNRDPYLRHAGVMALQGLNDPKALENAWRDESAAVRLAALLALRRMKDPAIAGFFRDPALLNVDETARAIYDEPIDAALPKLAAVLALRPQSRPVWLRSIAANLRLGGGQNAQAVAALAGDKDAPEDARIEALWALANWSDAPNLDRVTGLYRPLPRRDPMIAAPAASTVISRLAVEGPADVRIAAIQAIQKLNIHTDLLEKIVHDKDAPPLVRATALRALEMRNPKNLNEALKVAFDQGRGTPLRPQAIAIMIRRPDARERVTPIFHTGDLPDRKAVLEALASAPPGIGDAILSSGLDALLAGSLPPEMHLDLLEAAEKSQSPDVVAKLKSFEQQRAARAKNDPLANYTESLHGGDVPRGRRIFFEQGSVACLRCHKVGGDANVVGPDLAGIAAKKDRRYLLESIVNPNAQIAPGFESVILHLADGDTVYGVVKKETDTTVTVEITEEGPREVPKSEIKDRRKSLSAMPEGMHELLSKKDLRDVVEFMATLKDETQYIDPRSLGANRREIRRGE